MKRREKRKRSLRAQQQQIWASCKQSSERQGGQAMEMISVDPTPTTLYKQRAACNFLAGVFYA